MSPPLSLFQIWCPRVSNSVKPVRAQRPPTLRNFSSLRAELPLFHYSATILPLILPPAYHKSHRPGVFFHVTRLRWLLIGQACGDRRSCCFAAAVRKVPTLQIKTTPSSLCDFSSCEISWICLLDIAGGFSVHAHSELISV